MQLKITSIVTYAIELSASGFTAQINGTFSHWFSFLCLLSFWTWGMVFKPTFFKLLPVFVSSHFLCYDWLKVRSIQLHYYSSSLAIWPVNEERCFSFFFSFSHPSFVEQDEEAHTHTQYSLRCALLLLLQTREYKIQNADYILVSITRYHSFLPPLLTLTYQGTSCNQCLNRPVCLSFSLFLSYCSKWVSKQVFARSDERTNRRLSLVTELIF